MKYFLTLAVLTLVFSCQKERVGFCEGGEQCNLMVSPNPFDDAFEIELLSDIQDSIVFDLISINGKLINRRTEYLATGRNVFRFGTDSLDAGIYLMTVNTSEYFQNLRLLKDSNR